MPPHPTDPRTDLQPEFRVALSTALLFFRPIFESDGTVTVSVERAPPIEGTQRMQLGHISMTYQDFADLREATRVRVPDRPT